MTTNVERIALEGVGMRCPGCGAKSHIKDSRAQDGGIRRRRACKACRITFSTFEQFTGFDARAAKGASDPLEKRLRDEARHFANAITVKPTPSGPEGGA